MDGPPAIPLDSINSHISPPTMTAQERATQTLQASLDEAQRNGLLRDSLPARAHAWAMGVMAWYGYAEPERPDITSGYRSPAHQFRLLQRWRRGDREGLRAKPACQSWHTVGRAIDVETAPRGFTAYAYLLTEYTGARDGRNFGDRGHFDWPTSKNPPNICKTYT